MTDVFIDTNILLYGASADPAELPKAQAARGLIRNTRFGVSVQVLQEFYVNATGKLAKSIPPEKVETYIRLLKEQPVAEQTVELFETARELARRYQISYWDAAIIAAAKELGASIIYSEDLAHGQDYGGVKVLNPFLMTEHERNF